MSQSTHRTLTTHVGSLIRPSELLRLIDARQERKPVDAGVSAVIQHQRWRRNGCAQNYTRLRLTLA